MWFIIITFILIIAVFVKGLLNIDFENLASADYLYILLGLNVVLALAIKYNQNGKDN